MFARTHFSELALLPYQMFDHVTNLLQPLPLWATLGAPRRSFRSCPRHWPCRQEWGRREEAPRLTLL